ncbi:MAG TPA: SRPBCC domain-containing protein [Polyangiaceae bacterium]|nr:SRPBCC domain-containing protein [Polyangiaceae bacterium]
MSKQGEVAHAARRRVTLERTFKAPLEDVWELWTTKDGIESWWGPDGFRVEVHTLELRPGGRLVYDMIAVGAEQIEFVKKAGMPPRHAAHVTFTEVTPMTRLAYLHAADFIPGVDPYDVQYLVELFPSPDSVKMLLTFDAMHDAHWTNMATRGWEMELRKLERALAAHARFL